MQANQVCLICLSEADVAIVTPIPGTTRDIIQHTINLEGIPFRLLDTAGLRDSDDPIEQEGMQRAWQAIEQADLILFMIEVDQAENLKALKAHYLAKIPKTIPCTILINKIDLRVTPARCDTRPSTRYNLFIG